MAADPSWLADVTDLATGRTEQVRYYPWVEPSAAEIAMHVWHARRQLVAVANIRPYPPNPLRTHPCG